MSLRFFIDFDGTITKKDVIDMILERFAHPAWKETEEAWIKGKIGSRECLSRQLALVRATQEDLKALLEEIEIDPDFDEFLKKAREFNIPVTILSDGLDFVIHYFIKNLPVYCNQLRFSNGGLSIAFSQVQVCIHGCANCKVRVIEQLRQPGETVVFVGDGLSDRFAAEVSDLTFAKNKLLSHCREKKINHLEYSNFKDVQKWLADQSGEGGSAGRLSQAASNHGIVVQNPMDVRRPREMPCGPASTMSLNGSVKRKAQRIIK